MKRRSGLEQHQMWYMSSGADGFALRITAFMLVVFGAQSLLLSAIYHVLAGAMLLWPRLLRASAIWFGLAGVSAIVYATKWYAVDNHKYLLLYWLIACGIAVKTPDERDILSHNGRWLIGLCFACATLAKLLGGQYLDGSFLHFQFLTDERFHILAKLMGGLATYEIDNISDQLTVLWGYPQTSAAVTLASTVQLAQITYYLSIWVLCVEAVISMAFLVPRLRWLYRMRNIWLMVFIVTTYPIATIPAFGFLLAVLGLAQCHDKNRRGFWAYLTMMAIVLFSHLPKSIPDYLERIYQIATGL